MAVNDHIQTQCAHKLVLASLFYSRDQYLNLAKQFCDEHFTGEIHAVLMIACKNIDAITETQLSQLNCKTLMSYIIQLLNVLDAFTVSVFINRLSKVKYREGHRDLGLVLAVMS